MTHIYGVSINKVMRLMLAFLFAGTLVVGFYQVRSVGAQNASGSGLRISPTRTELILERGEARNITQTVTNVTQGPVTIEPQLNDFESNDVSGQPALIGDPNQVSANSLRDFVRLPEDFVLQPGEEREVSVLVEVPQEASPGGYFGSVFYRASSEGTGDGQVALIASVGSLVLVEVPGDIVEQVEFKDISAYLGKNSAEPQKGSLFTQKPDAIGVLVENLGNSFSKPFGKVSVTDWRGNEVFLYELNEGEVKSNVLPNSTRLFLDDLLNVETRTVNGEQETDSKSPISLPGRYTITGNLSHGTTGESFQVSSTFWYIPSWLIITLLAVVVAVVVFATVFYRRHHRKVRRR